MKNNAIKGIGLLALLLAVNILSSRIFLRMDLTSEKRYTLSDQSRKLIKSLDKPLEVILYLNGDLNPAFDRLRTSTTDMLDELSIYASHGITLRKVNPSAAPDEKTRQEHYLKMDKRGMRGTSVNEHDREGKLSSKVIYPWIELVYNGDTLPVSLLKKNINLTPQEVLNTSAGELEYNLTEGIRVLTVSNPEKIAFIDGHGEWSEPYVYEATNLLSRYYSVDRGRLSGNPEELLPYKVLIIASPQKTFSEKEKFALDQYLMNGGSILWLVDGTKISLQEFDGTGESSTLKQDVNLDDLLFTYGVRINPVTVQDMQCTAIRLASSEAGSKESFTTLPWYFAPLLIPSAENMITHNISPLKSEFVSTISFVGNDQLKKQVLLTTSPNAHTLRVPEKVSLRYVEMPAEESYFNEPSLPVAGLIEGKFPSAFINQLTPDSCIELPQGRLSESKNTRMIVVATGSIIKNEWKGQRREAQPVPVGFDEVSGEQLGNADFISNAVNYLARNDQWLNLRSHNYKLRLLNKQAINEQRGLWEIINIAIPPILLLITGFAYARFRKRKQ
ncbi:gliding motility-associated ABC transporter substrate-binding protein GldG [uncultured Bacteroides sp.]|uniref:gliding motility-associated ABC transporter substrate-binding protein GldG n=1 Tax=uncultured Bacteroides sp. TaxID=162156 RepID=UPI002AA9153D|nr:gliding motility-associated ABC transporter substrate-binding protein GldG [uncultured Bacteroides sp.]